jgi:(2R)-sulfolactate sulfo-lyase subunit alpha
MSHRFLVHDVHDNVGVLIGDAKAGERLTGAYLENPASVEVETKDAIGFGDKIALSNLKEGDLIIKYGIPIGQASKLISVGQHVHIHNLKSGRW